MARLLTMALSLAAASPGFAQKTDAPAPAEAATAPTPEDPTAAPAADTPPTDTASPAAAGKGADADALGENVQDNNPPQIIDFAVAAENPESAPRITAVVNDDETGVERVSVFFSTESQGARATKDYAQVDLAAGDGGLFLGSLPDGAQTTGFLYFVEVIDAAGNVTRLASKEQPLKVEPAKVGTPTRLARRPDKEAEPPPSVHPVWVMVALGGGVLATAVAAVFVVDAVGSYFVLQNGGLSGEQQMARQNALLGSAAIAGVAGAIGSVALVTGGGLLIYGAFTE